MRESNKSSYILLDIVLLNIVIYFHQTFQSSIVPQI